jgi:hypothetical protein
MNFVVKPGRIKLLDSYQVSKWDFLHELDVVRLQTWGSEVWKRSMTSLMREWSTHNALYALGIARERTADVDLNAQLKWYASAAYWLFGALVWPFIK